MRAPRLKLSLRMKGGATKLVELTKEDLDLLLGEMGKAEDKIDELLAGM